MRALIVAMLACLPASAAACGGLFCNNRTPVLQAAERILFAPDGEQMHMIVRLTWDGPPIEFGWLLPVPADVETWVGSEAMFQQLERYQPYGQLTTQFVGDCSAWGEGGAGGAGGAGGEGGGGGGGDGGVQVLSREPVGPYDRVILRAASVDGLVTWLRDNGFQVPDGAEPTLEPYLRLGLAFVALKLLPGANSNDVVPLHLRFTGQAMAIPLKPTAVAASPDMGIIVNILGRTRAVSTNYPHVVVDPAAISWIEGDGFAGSYPQVLAQAVDEAGGRAVVTEYAGPNRGVWLPLIEAGLLGDIEAMATAGELANALRLLPRDDDVRRAVRATVPPPEGVDPAEFLSCLQCYPEAPVDGAALAAALREQINGPRERIAGAFEAPWLTRLRTALSADEMDRDPIFAFNPDLPEVSNIYRLTRYVPCREGAPDYGASILQFDDGRRLTSPGQPITRQAGETVRGVGRRAALRIEQHFVAGQPEITADYSDAPPGPADPWARLGEPFPDLAAGGAGGGPGGAGGGLGGAGGGLGGAGGVGGGGDGAGGAGGGRDDAGVNATGGEQGCACRADDGQPPAPGALLALVALWGLRRRRR